MLEVTKTALSGNISELLGRYPDVSRLDLSKRMAVADGSLGRMKYGTGNPTLEVLCGVAAFFRVQPWQLLAPNGPHQKLTDGADAGMSPEAQRLVAAIRAADGIPGSDKMFAALTQVISAWQQTPPNRPGAETADFAGRPRGAGITSSDTEISAVVPGKAR